MPLANALVKPDEVGLPESRYPLALFYCSKCYLIQVTHVVSPEVLFRNYVYFSSVSQVMTQHFACLANDVASRFVAANGLVVEIGSNDGILLQSLVGRCRVLGVDPAQNVVERALAKGVPSIAALFSDVVASEIRKKEGPAAALLANNVFGHIHNLEEVMRGIDVLLDDDGVIVMEFPYVEDFLDRLEFDTIYHEHLSYFGVRPLSYLFSRFGFEIFDVERLSVHGGSIRVFVQRRGGSRSIERSVEALIELETSRSEREPERLVRFARDVEKLRDELRRLMAELLRAGKRVVGYTAPAKGIVLLNYCGFGPEDLEYTADATVAKQGLYCPGVKIPIRSPEYFRKDNPDYALLFAWNHKDEILEKEMAYRLSGGKFILPIPRVEVV
jgi:SAM-dependent methyltransferase